MQQSGQPVKSSAHMYAMKLEAEGNLGRPGT